jgi:hypothetical protein
MCSILGFCYVDVAASVITHQNVEFYKGNIGYITGIVIVEVTAFINARAR